jgi:hypothetical protein
MANVWYYVWRLIDELQAVGCSIALCKVKSHCTDEMVAQGIISAEDRLGNDIADHWCRYAADLLEYPETAYNCLQSTDAIAWQIQKRIIAIVLEFPNPHEKKLKQDGEADRLVIVNNQTSKIIDNGHIIVNMGKNLFGCERCAQTWRTQSRQTIIESGECPGGMIWKGKIPQGGRPIYLRKKEIHPPFIFNGQPVHESHKPCWYRGILYCDLCGSYSKRRMDGLPDECNLKPSNQGSDYRLKCMRRGKFPIKGQDFPLAEGAPMPYALRAWIGDE